TLHVDLHDGCLAIDEIVQTHDGNPQHVGYVRVTALGKEAVDGADAAADEKLARLLCPAHGDGRDDDVVELRGRDVVAQHEQIVRRGLDGDYASAGADESCRMHRVVADVRTDIDHRCAARHEALEQAVNTPIAGQHGKSDATR